MALVKTDHVMERVIFSFDEAGEVSDVYVHVNYTIMDDVSGEKETRSRNEKSVWADLTITEKSSANDTGKRLKVLAEAI